MAGSPPPPPPPPSIDRHTRKRRCSFADLARSQRARVIKTTYELIQAIGEEFSPGTRLDLLDRVFEHHTAKAGAAASPPGGRTSSESSVSSSEDGGGAGTGTKRSADPSEGAPRAADATGATAAASKRLRR